MIRPLSMRLQQPEAAQLRRGSSRSITVGICAKYMVVAAAVSFFSAKILDEIREGKIYFNDSPFPLKIQCAPRALSISVPLLSSPPVLSSIGVDASLCKIYIAKTTAKEHQCHPTFHIAPAGGPFPHWFLWPFLLLGAPLSKISKLQRSQQPHAGVSLRSKRSTLLCESNNG